MKNPRILVVRGGAIGDFIMTLPAIGALRERWPEAQIEILGYPHITELARGRYYADATRSIDAKPLSGFYIPHAVLDPGLVDYFRSFDLAVSYLYDPDQVFSNNVRRCGVKQLIEAPPRPVGCHASEHYCKPLEALAIYVTEPRPRVYLTDADRAFAANYLGGPAAAALVAVHPGSGSERKNWPAEKFAAVAAGLAEERAAALLVVQGEADDRAIAQFQRHIGAGAHRVVHGVSLVELAAVLERCALFLGNDSGITHLAAAVGVPTVAMFGPVSTATWEPRSWKCAPRVVRFGDHDLAAARDAAAQLWSGGSHGDGTTRDRA